MPLFHPLHKIPPAPSFQDYSMEVLFFLPIRQHLLPSSSEVVENVLPLLPGRRMSSSFHPGIFQEGSKHLTMLFCLLCHFVRTNGLTQNRRTLKSIFSFYGFIFSIKNSKYGKTQAMVPFLLCIVWPSPL